MKNNQIINLINRYCVNKEELYAINVDAVYTILAHGYLFVKPGEATDNFMREIADTLKTGVAKGVDNYFENMLEPAPIEDFICFSVAETALEIARKAFDAQYFEEQCALLDGEEEECDEKILEKYLGLLNEAQLYDFMHSVGQFSVFYDLFEDPDKRSVEMELNELCCEIDGSIPAAVKNVKAYFEYRKKKPAYVFDYLSKETIVRTLCRAITRDVILAGNMARTLYYTNDCWVINCYTKMISGFQNVFHIDIYNPFIYEMSKKIEV